MRVVIAAGILVCALSAKFAYQKLFDISPDGIPTRMKLSEFPWGLAGEEWSESRQDLEEKVERKAGVSEYLNCTFTKKRQAPIWLYVGYYDGHSVESMHQPEICFPGGGWKTQNKRIENFNLPGVEEASFNLIEFKKSLQLKITAYTFFYENKFQPDQAQLERGRVFGERHFAILTVATNVSDSIEESRDNIEELLSKIIPELLKHFPAAKD